MIDLVIFVSVLLVGCTRAAWKNSYDGPLHFECPMEEYVSRFVSEHNSRKEDRVWDFSCRQGYVGTDCTWTGYVNSYDKVMDFTCPDNGIITGLESVHNSRKEDRIWKLKCCKLQTIPGKSCAWTHYINEYDKYMDYTVGSGKAVVGMYSEHNSRKEDRKYRLRVCSFTTCIAKNIKILDHILPKEAGVRVVGLTTMQGCSEGHQYALHLGSTDSVQESNSITIGKSKEFNFNTEISVTATASAKFLGTGGELSFGAAQSFGGAVTATEDKSKETTTGRESSAQVDAQFTGPGAALIIADVKEYELEYDNVNVEVDVKCDNGKSFTERKTMKLTSKTFGQTHFNTMIGKFNPGKCNRQTNDCIRYIEGQRALQPYEVINQFKNCFRNGVGTVAK